MKNKLIISLISLFICTSVNCQTTFFKCYPSDSTKNISTPFEVDNGYIFSGYVSDQYNNLSNPYLLKIDLNGNVWGEKSEYLNIRFSTYENILSQSSNSDSVTIIKYCSYLVNDTAQSYLSFDKFHTNNLNLISEKRSQTQVGKRLSISSVIKNENSIFAQIGFSVQPHTQMQSGNGIIKYTNNFDSITSFQNLSNNSSIGFFINTIENKIYSFSLGSSLNVLVDVLDTNLNLISQHDLNNNFVTQSTAKQFSNSSYILTGTGFFTGVPTDNATIKVCKYNMNHVLLDSAVIINHPDTNLYAGAGGNNTEIINDTIFVVSCYNFAPITSTGQNSPTWIQVTRIDSNMQIIDNHFYGGDAYYFPFNIKKTSDGGAIIVGNRFDVNNPDNHVFNAFVLKINSSGEATGIFDENIDISKQAFVYPNPGFDFLNLITGEQLKTSIFKMYDINGKLILSKDVNSSEMKINTSGLKRGTYIWNVTKNSIVTESGKWIKQ